MPIIRVVVDPNGAGQRVDIYLAQAGIGLSRSQIKRLFGEYAAGVAVSSTKSMTGHLLGAAGGFEAGLIALALRHQIMPPTINLETPDPECDLDFVPLTARPAAITHALSNSFGFGGTNAALLMRRFDG